jgi:hypothetical protein
MRTLAVLALLLCLGTGHAYASETAAGGCASAPSPREADSAAPVAEAEPGQAAQEAQARAEHASPRGNRSIGSGEAGTANRLQRPRWQRLLPGMFR